MSDRWSGNSRDQQPGREQQYVFGIDPAYESAAVVMARALDPRIGNEWVRIGGYQSGKQVWSSVVSGTVFDSAGIMRALNVGFISTPRRPPWNYKERAAQADSFEHYIGGLIERGVERLRVDIAAVLKDENHER